MIRVFLDASVIIAALLSPNGGSHKLIELGNSGLIKNLTSQTVIDEVINNSSKIKRTEKQIIDFISKNTILVRERVETSETERFKKVVELKDTHVLAGSVTTRCTHLATLDKKHLLQPKVKKGMKYLKVVTPKEILEEIVS